MIYGACTATMKIIESGRPNCHNIAYSVLCKLRCHYRNNRRSKIRASLFYKPFIYRCHRQCTSYALFILLPIKSNQRQKICCVWHICTNICFAKITKKIYISVASMLLGTVLFRSPKMFHQKSEN